MLNILLQVILPTFLVAASGAVLQRWRRVPVTALSQVSLYLFAPALVFTALVETPLTAGVSLRIIAALLLTLAGVGLISLLVSLLLRHQRSMQSAFLLTTVFPNSGNLALPVVFWGFGDEGLAVAIIIFTVSAALAWSLGLFLASRSQLNGLAALREVFKTPAIYAVLAALPIGLLGWETPAILARPLGLLAGGAIPAMLIVLGFQIGSGIALEQLPSLVSALTIRLALAAPLSYGVTLLLGLDGVTQQVVIVVASMPPAVFSTLLATEFEAHPKFVSATVVTGTVVSVVTLTIVISLVQRWLG